MKNIMFMTNYSKTAPHAKTIRRTFKNCIMNKRTMVIYNDTVSISM